MANNSLGVSASAVKVTPASTVVRGHTQGGQHTAINNAVSVIVNPTGVTILTSANAGVSWSNFGSTLTYDTARRLGHALINLIS
jgi:hypothetical protein